MKGTVPTKEADEEGRGATKWWRDSEGEGGPLGLLKAPFERFQSFAPPVADKAKRRKLAKRAMRTQ
jgi:hypothetical protein